ncbi:MAG TPA: hypothetical protein PLH72_17375 [Vicinamibacterales bacterium]|nr:hypothetical protein [Vicinamibacterales bacterium]
MTTLTLRLDGREVVARVDVSGQVFIDDQTLTVTPSDDGLYLVSDGTRRWPVAVAASGDTCWVSIGGQVAVIEVESGRRRTPRRKSVRADALMAPMPATVVKVLAEPGQTVVEGDTLLVLEAMKMELPVRAPRAGVVGAIRCTAGELVQPGIALVDLE